MNAFSIKLSKKFEKLSIHARIFISVSMVVFLYYFWQEFVEKSIISYKRDLVDKTNDLQNSIEDFQKKILAATEIIKQNPQLVLKKQVEDARNMSDLLDKEIYKKTANMVSPKDMNQIISYMLNQSNGLSVVKIDSLEKKAFSQPNQLEHDEKKKKLNIFEHGISIEMIGGYFETFNFLRNLEKNRLNVVWDEISYEVLEYPSARIKIVMHTLSLDEGWIGV